MTKRGLIILVVAVLAVGFGAAAIASSIGGSDAEPGQHVMPSGETMNDSEMGTTSDMPEGEHEMPDGEQMHDSEMGSDSSMEMGE